MKKEIFVINQEIKNGICYVSDDIPKKNGRHIKAKCFCGKEFITRLINIKNENTKSCGCLNDKTRKNNALYKHGLSRTKLYKVFTTMEQRCHNPKDKAYKHYGARGIMVCDDWRNDFTSFYDWAMINGYQEGLEIDRIDSNKSYTPSNCRFVNRTIQCQNTRLIHKHNTSGYRGVCWTKSKNKWKACIQVDKKHKHLLYSDDAYKCALAYDAYVLQHNIQSPTNFKIQNMEV